MNGPAVTGYGREITGLSERIKLGSGRVKVKCSAEQSESGKRCLRAR
jgi:hypothetical protein